VSSRDPALPPKPYFRIGEVSHLVGVEPHVLRYWEREFRSIRPTKSAKGQRVYSQRDVEKLLRVRELLYTQGFTIAGAKKQLQDAPRALTTEAPTREPMVARGPVPLPTTPIAPVPAAAPAPVALDAPARVDRPVRNIERPARSGEPRASFTTGDGRHGGGPRKELMLLREEIEALLCELSE
jgi:DNA-binding transcriptional MerR regulator